MGLGQAGGLLRGTVTGPVPVPPPATERASAKLTLVLRVRGVRTDGYHHIDAEMVTVDLADVLTFAAGDGLQVVGGATGVPEGADNLVVRALAAVGRKARVRLEKRIPVGAGLGGGSADAAAVLRWAGCHDLGMAAALGADVPFCLVGGRARVTGVGETVEPLPPVERWFTLQVPPFGVPTAAVYRAWDRLGGPTGMGTNDLEPAALAVEPDLARWRDRLGDATGCTPMLAGSGSAWFVEGAHPGEGRVVTRSVPATAARQR
ncbi:MAG: 4-(cytidine 5'-diphospho)-2-C-methyl-D-erythritol kinase [Acidimicrobiales bacterium]